MPQFDTATFFSQLFWLTITFYGFYIIMIQNYVPALTRIFKVRRKKLELAQSQGSAFEDERLETIASFENIFSNSANESRTLLAKTQNSGAAWMEESLADANNKALKQVNHNYLYLNGEIRGQRYIIQQVASASKK